MFYYNIWASLTFVYLGKFTICKVEELNDWCRSKGVVYLFVNRCTASTLHQGYVIMFDEFFFIFSHVKTWGSTTYSNANEHKCKQLFHLV